MCHLISFPKKLQRMCWCCLSDFDELSSKTASSNSLFTITLGDLNARSSSRWKKAKTAAEGTHLEVLTSFHNFHQLISERSLLLPHSNSCIDLIFMDQRNLVVNCGTHEVTAVAFLNPKCHHQNTCCKINLNIEYLPSYEWLVWNHRKANIESIKKSVESVNRSLSLTKLSQTSFSIFLLTNWLHLMIVILLG